MLNLSFLILQYGFKCKIYRFVSRYIFVSKSQKEQAQIDKTNKQCGTLNPEYNQTFKLQIHRKQSKFMRFNEPQRIKAGNIL